MSKSRQANRKLWQKTRRKTRIARNRNNQARVTSLTDGTFFNRMTQGLPGNWV